MNEGVTVAVCHATCVREDAKRSWHGESVSGAPPSCGTRGHIAVDAAVACRPSRQRRLDGRKDNASCERIDHFDREEIVVVEAAIPLQEPPPRVRWTHELVGTAVGQLGGCSGTKLLIWACSVGRNRCCKKPCEDRKCQNQSRPNLHWLRLPLQVCLRDSLVLAPLAK